MNNKIKFSKTIPTILTILICLLVAGIIMTFITKGLDSNDSKMNTYMNLIFILVILTIAVYGTKNLFYPSIKIHEDCFNIYKKLNEALYDGNIDIVAEFISPEIYNEYKEKEMYLKENNNRTINAILGLKKAKTISSNTVEFHFNMVEYVLDDNNKVVGINNQVLTSVKIGYSKDKNHFMCRCKKCKVYYKDKDIDNCEKCGSKLVKDNYSVVITSIKKEA